MYVVSDEVKRVTVQEGSESGTHSFLYFIQHYNIKQCDLRTGLYKGIVSPYLEIALFMCIKQ